MGRYQFAPLKDNTYPEIDDIKKALKKADNESEKDRDVRPLMAIEMRMVEASGRLRGHVLTRRTAITSYDWDIAPDDKADIERAQEVRARLKKTINRILNRHTQTPLFGALAIKLEPVDVEGKWSLRPVRIYRPDEIERTGDDLDDVAILVSEGAAVKREYPDNPQTWITETDEDTFVQGGILRSLIYNEKLRLDNVQEWANANRKIKGLLISKLKEFASDADKSVAKQTLSNVNTYGFGITSDAADYEFLQIITSAGSQWFSDFIKLLSDEESIAILGQANTTQLPNNGGSRAALQVLQLIRADIHYADIVRIEQTLMPQLLLADHQLNHDPAALVAPWRFALRLAEDRDAEKEIRTIAEALQSGVSLKRQEVYERINYSMPADGDDILTPTGGGLLSSLLPSGAGGVSGG